MSEAKKQKPKTKLPRIKSAQYNEEAYRLLLEALSFTVSRLPSPRHVSGQELSLGIRDFVLEHYGPLAKTVLTHWGIFSTDDFGKIVYEMIESGILKKESEDKLEDFSAVYDFEDAFVKTYKIPE